MALLRVKYTMTVEQDIDWPDDKLEDLNYENLMINLDQDDAHEWQIDDIQEITKNGEDFNF
tara:strand:+ start:259 stop:441 length:183 start_codon:yes stop_codon:yes gene_type:complete